MGKTRKNISIDSELAEIVDSREEFNLSGFVNACLEQHFAQAGATSPAETAMRARLEELEAELEDLEREQHRIREKRNEIEEQLEEESDSEHELIEQARETLSSVPREPDNPAIQNWAGKLGITPEQLIDELEAHP